MNTASLVPVEASIALLIAMIRQAGGVPNQSLPSSEDWGNVTRQALEHGLGPLLHRRLVDSSGSIAVPPAIFDTLRRSSLTNLAHNLRLLHACARAISLLQIRDIPAIVLKGAHLGEIVYENPGLRPMADIDIMVRKKDFSAAEQILGDNDLLPETSSTPVDLRWMLDTSLRAELIDLDSVWERARQARIGNAGALVLAPEDLILHLCVHISSHHLLGPSGLLGLVDLRTCIRHYQRDLDWEALVARARLWQCTRPTALCLTLSRDLFWADLPEGVLSRLTPEGIAPEVTEWARSRILSAPHPVPDVSPGFWHLVHPGLPIKKKLAAAFRMIFPTKRYALLQKPTRATANRKYLADLFHRTNRLGTYGALLRRVAARDKSLAEQALRECRNREMKHWMEAR